MTFEQAGTQGVFVAPDSVEFLSLLGTNFTGFFDKIGFNFRRLAGAKVLEIAGMDAFAYADLIARTESGNYLDHNVRVNSVFSSYRIVNTSFSQRFGDLAGPPIPTQDNLTMSLMLVNATEAEDVTIPFLANFIGTPFTDSASLCVFACLLFR